MEIIKISKKNYKRLIKNSKEIDDIGNYYGGLLVSKLKAENINRKKDKYFWGIENYNGTGWEEIPEKLYNSLIEHEELRKKNE